MSALTCLQSTARLAGQFALAALLVVGSVCQADDRSYRVAVIGYSPPLSYTDESGKLTGFNIEVAHELCATLQIRCQLQPMPIENIVDSVAADDSAFAVVGFIPTPERQQRVLFSKTYFHSRSVWLARPGLALGKSPKPVAVIKGSAQARHAEAMGWKSIPVVTQNEIPALLSTGKADATLLPMLGALALLRDKSLQPLLLESTILTDPTMSGSLHMLVSPKEAPLVERLNAAIDQIKRDGRFDRLNSQFMPWFKIQ
ncbi:hypothetical protein AT959_10935 [Dechloromonas denitrificans]|uniref:Solute-binding protein family 3/N-terminal domain-containing protein n=1 Tax=Dechloromonas denitrificans TaxID=281362 RepID=A0A133XJT8_9RHOO|nr:transporter substrate-binding domain-containing protein [Dechloromonas denitrificans]KXB31187.1 hypothetical protein AT959_10935 [Dechloromonas denitrificans]